MRTSDFHRAAGGRPCVLRLRAISQLASITVLTLMAVFDATSAQVVTWMRKVITFALSFVFFPHGKSFTVTMLHAFGICLSLGAAFILEHGRTRKASL